MLILEVVHGSFLLVICIDLFVFFTLEATALSWMNRRPSSIDVNVCGYVQ